jgi:hypothetical protein
MSVLTKEEVEWLLARAIKENDELRKENDELSLIVADALERLKLAENMTIESQKMLNKLLEVIKTRYDAEFNIGDMQK